MSNNTSERHHLGTGSLELRREHSVFINCPFDAKFRPLFDALIFATLCCGFIPRSALESGAVSISRMDRIARALQSSKYSIHDLSRCRGEGESNLARFNMPLELGMAMNERFRDTEPTQHDWLALVPQGNIYRRYLSDLSGYDPSEHDETIETLVPIVMSWLATRPDAVRVPTPQAVLGALRRFQEAKEALSSEWGGCEPWPDLLMEGLRIASSEGLIPKI